jgi:hypothetical protein
VKSRNLAGFILSLSLAWPVLQQLPARAAPANTLIDMWAGFRYCLRSADLDQEAELTLRLSLKRDGSLYGRPTVSYFNMSDVPEVERRNVEAITKAIDACVPISISDELGNAIAGRPLWIHLHGPPAPPRLVGR